MTGALDGIRILDLSWGIAGPLGVLLMAEQGADVIKVEPPGGDPFRSYQGSAVWNRSRRSVTSNLKTSEGHAAFMKLAATADVVVDSFRPGVMERLGLGQETLRRALPRLVTCSVPGYPPGHRFEQRPGYDALVQASSGQQWEQPGWRKGPIFLHMPMPSMAAAFLVPAGITTALIVRERTGRGQHVQTSLWHASFLYTTQLWQHFATTKASFHAIMAKTYPPGVHQSYVYECADREWLHLSLMSGLAPLATIEEVLGLPPAPSPLELFTMAPEDAEKFRAAQRAGFQNHNRDVLVARFQANNFAAEAIVPMEEALRRPHAQLAANDMVVDIEDPELGPTTQIGIPINLMGTPGAIRGPQPRVGEHNSEVWGALGYSDGDITTLTRPETAEARR